MNSLSRSGSIVSMVSVYDDFLTCNGDEVIASSESKHGRYMSYKSFNLNDSLTNSMAGFESCVDLNEECKGCEIISERDASEEADYAEDRN